MPEPIEVDNTKPRGRGAAVLERVPIWDLAVMPTAADSVIAWINERRADPSSLLLNHNLHSVYLTLRDPGFRKAYSVSDRVIIDGFPILLLVNLRRSLEGKSWLSSSFRCGSTDWISKFESFPQGYRIAVLGASVESNARAIANLSNDYPSLVFSGWDGYEGLSGLVSGRFLELQSFEPDLVLVGLGMPYQERFLIDSWSSLPRAVYATVGGAIDQVAGVQKLAPRWLGRFGLEWIWRLMCDPRRLYHRYLVEPMLLIVLTLRKLLVRD